MVVHSKGGPPLWRVSCMEKKILGLGLLQRGVPTWMASAGALTVVTGCDLDHSGFRCHHHGISLGFWSVAALTRTRTCIRTQACIQASPLRFRSLQARKTFRFRTILWYAKGILTYLPISPLLAFQNGHFWAQETTRRTRRKSPAENPQKGGSGTRRSFPALAERGEEKTRRNTRNVEKG